MKKMNTAEMYNVNAGARCPYCKKKQAWYALWLHKILCGMIYNPSTKKQRRYS